MDITIRIDDNSRFKDLVKEELAAFKPEELHEVIKSAIREALVADNYEIARRLIMEKGRYWNDESPTSFTYQIIKQCDFSELQDVVDEMIRYLKEDHKKVLENILFDALSSGLVNTYNFRQGVEDVIRDVQRRDANDNSYS